jgi:N-dimethylarginine dimethylaminohydrolase
VTAMVQRSARSRHYLMCPPRYFAVSYAINPWMDPSRPSDAAAAVQQWSSLRDLLQDLGHTVDVADPVAGLPDMVFTANAATVIDDRVLVAAFRHRERAPEADAYEAWFRVRGFPDVRRAAVVNEGQGDHLAVGDLLLSGSGFRTLADSHQETGTYLGRTVVPLTLVDPRFYHLDTALAVLDDQQIMYFPPAFCPRSRATLEALFPDAVIAGEADAVVLGLNAVSDGHHVVLPAAATALAAQLTAHGFEPVGVHLEELLNAGGGPKCCTLEIHHPRPADSVLDAA